MIVALPLCHVVVKLRGTWGSDGSSGADNADTDIWNLS